MIMNVSANIPLSAGVIMVVSPDRTMFIRFPYTTPNLSVFFSIVNSHWSILNGKGLVGHFVLLFLILTVSCAAPIGVGASDGLFDTLVTAMGSIYLDSLPSWIDPVLLFFLSY